MTDGGLDPYIPGRERMSQWVNRQLNTVNAGEADGPCACGNALKACPTCGEARCFACDPDGCGTCVGADVTLRELVHRAVTLIAYPDNKQSAAASLWLFDAGRRLPWRVGRKVGRTIYAQVGQEPSDDDLPIGVMDSAMLALDAVTSHNAGLDMRAKGHDDT